MRFHRRHVVMVFVACALVLLVGFLMR